MPEAVSNLKLRPRTRPRESSLQAVTSRSKRLPYPYIRGASVDGLMFVAR